MNEDNWKENKQRKCIREKSIEMKEINVSILQVKQLKKKKNRS